MFHAFLTKNSHHKCFNTVPFLYFESSIQAYNQHMYDCMYAHFSADHTVGLIITIIGVVMLDYSADSCDSPSKAYMIDVCDQEDLDRGLNIRALLGGKYKLYQNGGTSMQK